MSTLIKRLAQAGSFESGDVLVQVAPSPEKLAIHIKSKVGPRFSSSMQESVRAVAAELGVTANTPALIIDAPVFTPDSIILDLEDAVAVDQKDAARELVVSALVPVKPHALRLAMVESAEDIACLDELLGRCEADAGLLVGTVKIMASIETAKGVMNANAIALSSPRLVAMSFGAEDFTNSIQSERTPGGHELLYARTAVVLAARAAGIDPIDTVFTLVEDDAGFKADVRTAKQLGFAGKSCVHPRQIALAHEVFLPTPEELSKAERVLAAYTEALERGVGVVAVEGRMVDGPIVARAQRIVDIANASKSLREVRAR
ncbi:MAG: Citrate lyase subunit beta [Firmicutes bacterium]|nr:Citrate lyase subunit beta [candidate division NPL-UPA2 bacterium]